MENSIVPTGDINEITSIAQAMVKSGYFADAREVSQAIVKILAGRELGFGAFTSMSGIYIVKGKPSISANLMAAAVKRSGKYDYIVREQTDKVCRIEFFQAGKSIGVSSFTIEEAHKAGTQNLEKFPKNMLFARAMSNGVRWFTPDVFSGAPTYTPEELGANTNEEGEIIEGEIITPSSPASNWQPEQPAQSPELAKYIARYQTLVARAAEMGIHAPALPESPTLEVVKTHGLNLKSEIERMEGNK